MNLDYYANCLYTNFKKKFREENSSVSKAAVTCCDGNVLFTDAVLTRFEKNSDIVINAHLPQFTTPHYHEFFELIYVHSGSLDDRPDGHSLHLSRGDFLLLGKGVVHTPLTVQKESIIINILMRQSLFESTFVNLIMDNHLFAGFFVESLFQNKKDPGFLVFRGDSIDSETMDHYLSMLLKVYMEDSDYSEMVIENLLPCIFVELTKGYRKSNCIKEQPKNDIANIFSYLSKNFSSVTLEETAAYFHYHPKYLTTLLKKYSGFTFSEIIRNYKMKYACNLLTNSKLSILQVMEEVGYTNRGYFCRAFYEKFGMTPTEYRRKNQKL